jgi:hypothetical protein
MTSLVCAVLNALCGFFLINWGNLKEAPENPLLQMGKAPYIRGFFHE